MKKIAMSVVAAVLLPTVAATSAFAAGRGANFTDSDGDGVCDYYGTDLSAGYGANFTDSDGDGVCDYYGTGCGAGFTDSDGDGVCDYYGTGRGAGRGGRWA